MVTTQVEGAAARIHSDVPSFRWAPGTSSTTLAISQELQCTTCNNITARVCQTCRSEVVCHDCVRSVNNARGYRSATNNQLGLHACRRCKAFTHGNGKCWFTRQRRTRTKVGQVFYCSMCAKTRKEDDKSRTKVPWDKNTWGMRSAKEAGEEFERFSFSTSPPNEK